MELKSKFLVEINWQVIRESHLRYLILLLDYFLFYKIRDTQHPQSQRRDHSVRQGETM